MSAFGRLGLMSMVSALGCAAPIAGDGVHSAVDEERPLSKAEPPPDEAAFWEPAPFVPDTDPACGRPCRAVDLGCPLPGVTVCDSGEPVCTPLDGGLRGEGVDGAVHVRSGEVVILDRPRYDLTRLHVESGGRLEVRPTRFGGGPVVIRVLGEATVDAGGIIELSGRGWPGGAPTRHVQRGYPDAWTNAGGSTGAHGFGPAGGGGGWAAPQEVVGSGGGGGHVWSGADGTRCVDDERGFAVWDVNSDAAHPVSPALPDFSAGGDAIDAPLAMGSGGGAGANNFDGGSHGVGGAGGAGGGALRLTAARIRVDGTIRADGDDGADGEGHYVGGGGGGAGGTIHLVAVAVEVDGALSALGGAGGAGASGLGWGETIGGAGGVGRIRLSGPVVDVDGTVDPPFEEGLNACEGGPGAD